MVAVVITMAGALALGNSSTIPVNTEGVPIEIIDEYLSENGFSEEFILQTGEQTKRALYEEGGVFDSDSELNISPLLDLGQDWEGFTATLTASHLSYEDNVSTKFLVFNWKWNTSVPLNVLCDAVSIYWGDSFTAIPSSAGFEISGRGTASEAEQRHPGPGMESLPFELSSLSFLFISGDSAITQYEPNVGIAFKFNVDENMTKKMYYGSSWADYRIAMNDFGGSYSIKIVKTNSNPNYNGYNSAVANYFRWTSTTTYDFSFSIGYPGGVNLNIDPNLESYYEKSVDKAVSFRYMN